MLSGATADALDLRLERNIRLGLWDAVQLALERNPRLRIARAQLRAAEAGLSFAEAARGPKLSLGSGMSYGFTYQGSSVLVSSFGNGSGPTLTSSQAWTLPSVGLTLNWPMVSSALIEAQVASAESALQDARLEVERQLQQIKLAALSAYLNLQQAQGNVEIRRLALQNAEATQKDTEILVRAGQSTRFELVRSQVQVLQARQRLQEAQSEAVVARRELARQLNFSQPTDILASDEIVRSQALEMPLEQAVARALNNRVELQQDRARALRASSERAVALAQFAPQLQLVSSLDYGNAFNSLYQVSAVGRGPANLSGVLANNQSTLSVSLGLQVSLALSDAGAAAARALQAEAQKEIAELNLVDDTNQVRFEVERAFVQLAAAAARRQIGTQQVALAQQSLEYARLRYRASVGSQLDVINATNDLIQARADVLATTLSYNQADANLRRALGEL